MYFQIQKLYGNMEVSQVTLTLERKNNNYNQLTESIHTAKQEMASDKSAISDKVL